MFPQTTDTSKFVHVILTDVQTVPCDVNIISLLHDLHIQS